MRHSPPSARIFEIPWNPNTRTEVSTLCISQFRYSAQIRPSSVVTKDYTFKPGWAGRFEQEGQHRDYQRTQYEVYDYPGRFKGCPRAELCPLADGRLAKQCRNRAGNESLAGDMAGTTNCADGASAGEPEPGMAGGGK